jgi:hypothetical protein
MVDQPYEEGHVLTNPDTGEQVILQNNQWVPHVSVGQDMAKTAVPALEKGAVGLMTLPHTLANMAATGVNELGNSQFADWPQSIPGRATQAVQDFTGRNSYPTVISDIEKESGPFYKPQTVPGKLEEGALSTAPMALLGGPEALAPNMVRALLSGTASEGAGQLTAGTPYETAVRMAAGAGAYMAPGAAWRPAINPNTPRAAMASTLENAGVPVSKADITGNRLTSTLEGQPPSGQVTGLSDTMKQMGGIVRAPGDVRPFSQLVEQRGRDLSHAVQGLEANTNVPATPALRTQLAAPVARHLAANAGTSLENPLVEQGLQDYDAMSMGGTLNGKNYHDLTDQWSNSGIPELREMANSLHGAMNNATASTPYAGAWNTWRQNWADLQGLKAASEGTGESTLQPLGPDKVVGAMHRRTPMRDVAEAGQGILGTRPPPYGVDSNTMAHIAGAGLGAGGFLAGGGLHGAGGYEPGVYGLLMGEVLPRAVGAMAAPVQAAFRSRPGQNFLRNLDPKMVAALLANQGIQAKGAPQTPQPPAQ